MAQSIVRDVRIGDTTTYSYVKDGIRHYSHKRPQRITYGQTRTSYLIFGDVVRINGMPCSSDCEAELSGYRMAQRGSITDFKECPELPAAESAGCRLWALEHKR